MYNIKMHRVIIFLTVLILIVSISIWYFTKKSKNNNKLLQISGPSSCKIFTKVQEIFSINVNQTLPSVGYVFNCENNNIIFSANTSKLNISRDGGNNWKNTAIDDTNWCRGFSNKDKQIVWSNAMGASTGKIYISTDFFDTFTQYTSNIAAFVVQNYISINDSNVITIASNNQIYQSEDNGNIFKSILTIPNGVINFRTDQSSNIMFISQTGDKSPLTLSIDGGKSWINPSLPVPQGYNYSYNGIVSTDGKILSVLCNGSDSNYSYNYLFKSYDLGKSWQQEYFVQSDDKTYLFTSVISYNNGWTTFIGDNKGNTIYSYLLGRSWQKLNTGSTDPIYEIISDDLNNVYMLTSNVSLKNPNGYYKIYKIM
jgi:hypothetical protein